MAWLHILSFRLLKVNHTQGYHKMMQKIIIIIKWEKKTKIWEQSSRIAKVKEAHYWCRCKGVGWLLIYLLGGGWWIYRNVVLGKLNTMRKHLYIIIIAQICNTDAIGINHSCIVWWLSYSPQYICYLAILWIVWCMGNMH